MTALLGLIFSKDGFYGAIIVAGLIFGVHEHNKLLAEGIAEQKAADDKATAALVANTAKQTAELQAKATMAEQAFEKQQTDLQNFRASNPVQPVRLCLNTHSGNSVVSQAGSKVGGDQGAGAASGNVQQVSPGDSSGGAGAAGPDISGMLDLLAARADQVSAELREDQSRE